MLPQRLRIVLDETLQIGIQQVAVGSVGPPRQGAAAQEVGEQLQVGVGAWSGLDRVGKAAGQEGVEPLAQVGFEAVVRDAAQVDLQPLDAIDPARRAEPVAALLDLRKQLPVEGHAQVGLPLRDCVRRTAAQLEHLAHDLVLRQFHGSGGRIQGAVTATVTCARSTAVTWGSSARRAVMSKRACAARGPVGKAMSPPVPATGAPTAVAPDMSW